LRVLVFEAVVGTAEIIRTLKTDLSRPFGFFSTLRHGRVCSEATTQKPVFRASPISVRKCAIEMTHLAQIRGILKKSREVKSTPTVADWYSTLVPIAQKIGAFASISFDRVSIPRYYFRVFVAELALAGVK